MVSLRTFFQLSVLMDWLANVLSGFPGLEQQLLFIDDCYIDMCLIDLILYNTIEMHEYDFIVCLYFLVPRVCRGIRSPLEI